MDNRPVGIFDSGLGGLTAVRALRSLLPDENIIYFADTARMPYGAWGAEKLRVMAAQDLEFVASRGVKCILAACGTVSSTAPDVLGGFRVKTFNVLDSTVRECARSAEGPIGVIATEASTRSGAFKAAIERACPGCEVTAVACPDFVPLIERGAFSPDDPALAAAVREYLRPIKERGARTLVLGCTHYGLIAEALRAELGDGVRMIEAARCAAGELAAYLGEAGLGGGEGEESFYTSGRAEDFTALASVFLGRGLRSGAEHVPPMEV